MRIAALLVFLLVAVPPAAAEDTSPEQLFRQFGLFGIWASECAAPASPANPHVEISEAAPGVILEDHHLGSDYAVNRYSVLTAEKLSATRLSVVVLFHPGDPDEERQKLIFQIRDNTRRTVFNQADGGPVRVENGIALARGTETPLLKKCK
jgi:hypothetical protein